ncbi:MAG: adenine deaminase [Bacteroidales bacterium]|nr:adenine deaminase [Bacteroidales bacterium]MCF8389668.1 adenine deaminase [Bacteroidales bacterium]
MKEYSGTIVDIVSKTSFKGRLQVVNGRIINIEKCNDVDDLVILPGFVDSHIHIESSMLSPQNFAAEAVKHGTVAVVSDPHEIANVLGRKGVEYMINDAEESPLKFFFGAPSCVPATKFETSGAVLDAVEVEGLLKRDDIYFLSEMMNFPGVIYNDPDVDKKILAAKNSGKTIDGHGPGLSGAELAKYVGAGIETDHECFTYDEALEKIKLGMKIQIREGSAARNFESLNKLIDDFPEMVMLCSDDLHPDDLVKGHINLLIKRSLEKGLNLYNILRAVVFNPVKHYNIPVGMLQKGDPADMVIVNNLTELKIIKTIINGVEVFDKNRVLFEANKPEPTNTFYVNKVEKDSFKLKKEGGKAKVIEIIDGELVTRQRIISLKSNIKFIESDLAEDILKISVVNRYSAEKPSVGLIKGFGITKGGMVSTIAHDSHNIIVVGVDDSIMAELVGWAQQNKGGIAVHDGKKIIGIPLPIAGIISELSAIKVAEKYAALDHKIKELGSKLRAPFMTLSFMALLVIPELKIGNKGLFDVNTFGHTSIFID